MKPLALITLIVVFCPIVWASNPRGDDLIVDGVECRTHEFKLSPELKAKAIEARDRIDHEGRFGYTRTNPEGIIVALKVDDGGLWVTGIGISGGGGESGYAVHPTVIPTDIISEPILATWFTGELTGYHGPLLRFHVREFGFVFEVREGKITSQDHVRFTVD